MSEKEPPVQISGEDALHLLELTERAINSKDLAELSQEVLPLLIRVMGVAAAFLYFGKPKPSTHYVCQVGIPDLIVRATESICREQFNQIHLQADYQPLILSLAPQETVAVALFLLHDQEKRLGLLGLMLPEDTKLPNSQLLEKIIFLLTQFIIQIVKHLDYENRIANFNAYYTVSSKIAKALNLRDVLEAVLYSSMEAVSGAIILRTFHSR